MTRIDNSIPLMPGYIYQLGNSMSGNWVLITHIERGMVHAVGVENTIADLVVPTWKFDDLLSGEYALYVAGDYYADPD